MIVTIDFKNIDNREKLLKKLDDEFGFSKEMPKYGNNLDAFWDLYSFRDENDHFELVNYRSITDENFKKYVDTFISILDNLRGYEDNGKKIIPNPNFDYEVIS
ncbi:MAG: barstar family protein [Candidatus Buchananbacteria bacterium]|nr:barstar family protein [Candidatus Buchananbacteria bacterium]